MALSAGSIGLDLEINKAGFNKQLSSVTGMAKKAAGMIAGALAIKGGLDLTKECLELGSDLEEVQNVVDVTFPHMTAQIDKFAKDAAQQFGLSETMAKKFAGTYGSMAEAFGFTESQAAEMGTTLTGLAGDVASFYNISQDEAYTKLKSVFSGETETLKDLGIVMTQTALDAWAMANGFGKTTQQMSEAEKVSLRLAFVQSQLANATGDFARTSDSWANQTRILSLQFDSLKASIGQGLINLFSPIIMQINALMKKLVSVSALFKQFTALITGKKADDSGIKNVAKAADSSTAALGKTTGAANSLTKATKKAGAAAKKAAKDMLGLAGFDELNNFTKSDSEKKSDSSSGTGGAGGAGASLPIAADTDGANASLQKMNAWLEKIKSMAALVNAEIKKLVDAFKKGFQIGLGNTQAVFANIKSELASIGQSFRSIVSDKGLQQAVQKWAISLATCFGTIVGSIASIGLTIADNLLGGVSQYLKQHKKDLVGDLVTLFNVSSDINKIIGNFVAACADIFTVFRSPSAKQITADLINIFVTTFTKSATLVVKFGRDIINLLTKPITENKDKLKTAFQNTIKPLSTVIGSISSAWSATWEKIHAVYDSKVKPFIDSLATGISEWMGTFLTGYNTYIAPVLQTLAAKVKEVMAGNIQPAINAVIDCVGDFCDALKTLWEIWLQPIVNWAIKNIMPIFAKAFQNAGSTIISIFGKLGNIIKGIATALSGVCKTVKAIAEGDWKQAWEGVKSIVSGIWSAITNIFSAAWTAIKGVFKTVQPFFAGVWSGIKSVFSGVADFYKGVFAKGFNNIKVAFSTAKALFQGIWANIKAVFSNPAAYFKQKFVAAFNAVKAAFSAAKSTFQTVWNCIKAPFSGVAGFFKDKFSDAWEKVKNVFSTGGKIFVGIKEGIASTFKTIVNGLITGINKVVEKPFNAINGMLNTIREVGIGSAKPFKSLWSKNPITVPAIPKLAMGGYVKANTPQLAMIGDNRHQGEVVSPENKLQEMADAAAGKAGEVTASALIPVIERLCNAIIELENSGGGIVLEGVSDSGLYRIVKGEHAKERKRGVGYGL